MIYSLIYSMLAIFGFLNIFFKKDKLKISYLIISVVFILFTGTRDGIGGTDFGIYKHYFETLDINDFWVDKGRGFEVGYRVFNGSIKYFVDDYRILFFMITLTTLGVVFYCNYKYTNYPFFAFQFFLYRAFTYNNFVAMRQSFSVTIFIFSLKYIHEKKIKKYIFLIFIAFLFHKSAIILFPFYFIDRLKFSKMKIEYFLGLNIILYLFSSKIFILFQKIGVGNFSEKYSHYSVGQITNASYLNLLELITMYLLFKIVSKNIKYKRFMEINYNLFIVYFIISCAFIHVPIFERFQYYFVYSYIYIFVTLFEKLKEEKNELTVFAIFLFFSIIFHFGFLRKALQFGGEAVYKSWLMSIFY